MTWLKTIGTRGYRTGLGNQAASRLRLEPLEDRQLLSTCHVVRLGDFGAGADLGGGQSRGDLRYCINKANNEPGPDVIDITTNGTINFTGPLPDLASDIDIQGPGADVLTVRRDAGGDYRIFAVSSGVNVQISGLTITNGSDGIDPLCGGGIHNAGTLSLADSVITGNNVRNQGGGVCNWVNATLTMSHSFVTGNTLEGNGLYTYGAGIVNRGDMLIDHGVISDNVGTTQNRPTLGGGIANLGGTLTIIDSTIADNAAIGMVSIFSPSGGGIYNEKGIASIYNSTITGNRVENLMFGHDHTRVGGGVNNMAGVMSFLNSTISGNHGASMGGGVFVMKDPFNPIAPFTLISHSTITNNEAESGGGIYIQAASIVLQTYLRNTVVAGNVADAAPDLRGALTSSGYNLFGNSGGGSGYAATDILDVDPMLGPLTDNGGPTQTHALLPGSPAIDAGDNADAPEFDQRGPGFPRIVNGRIDIGAFEVQATGAPGISDHLDLSASVLAQPSRSQDPFGNASRDAVVRVSVVNHHADALFARELGFPATAFSSGTGERGGVTKRIDASLVALTDGIETSLRVFSTDVIA